MKKLIFTLVLFSLIYLTSCQKDSVSLNIKPTPASTSVPATTVLNQGTASSDSALNNIKGYFRLQLSSDTINTDNILISFNPAAKTKYVGGEDAPTFQGFGLVSLSSFSSDNVALAINALPLTSKGVNLGLRVNAKTDGIYKLGITTIKNIPDAYQIWLMDTFKKDSLDMRQNASYAFNIYKDDSASFGSDRFKLVVRAK
jgi:hypothetical protein